MITLIYAIMHFLVDFICAWAMFGFFQNGETGYLNILIYNFCAFALQMPLGTLLDWLRTDAKRKNLCAISFSAAGIALTIAGSCLHPAVLGLGNALFHVGGGMDVIQEDFGKKKGGSLLGVFVAPGAIGLYLGSILGKNDPQMDVLVVAAAVLMLLLWFLYRCGKREEVNTPEKKSNHPALPVVCCFLVVILRSWIGLEVSFPWKTTPVFGLLAVLCVVTGKMLGGFAAAKWGVSRIVKWSLLLGAVCFVLSSSPLFGLLALLLFNMSMPITLYLLVRELPGMWGFSFGLLTFGLFLGFLPVYSGLELPLSDAFFGAVGCLISFILLMAMGKAMGDERISV